MINEVTVFATGDPNHASTWSNIPYFLVDVLKRNGVTVNTVDLSPNRLLKLGYDICLRLPVKLLFPGTHYAYFRTPLHAWDAKRRIVAAIRRYPRSTLNIFMTYTFSANGYGDLPSVQICDWPFDYQIRTFLDRKADILESAAVNREKSSMQKTDLVISLFDGVSRYLRSECNISNCKYYGHVINCGLYPDKDQLLTCKSASDEILFIGGRHYRKGAHRLIKAFKKLRVKYPSIKLNVIGMSAKEIGQSCQGLICHGRLNKDKHEESIKYYKLLSKARVIVNPTPKWAGFSSLVEAMYFYTPIVTTQFHEFKITFGDVSSFGSYCKDEGIEDLSKCIESLLDNEGYTDKCINAHNQVHDFTWDAFWHKVKTEVALIKNAHAVPNGNNGC